VLLSRKRRLPTCSASFPFCNRPISYDTVEVEGVRQPGGGAIDVSIDGNFEKHYDLSAKQLSRLSFACELTARMQNYARY
jgi:hypothetical protein